MSAWLIFLWTMSFAMWMHNFHIKLNISFKIYNYVFTGEFKHLKNMFSILVFVFLLKLKIWQTLTLFHHLEYEIVEEFIIINNISAISYTYNP